VDSLAGRLGVRFARTGWVTPSSWLTPCLAQPAQLTARVRPSVWQEFVGDPRTRFSSETGFIPFQADLGGTWGEIGTGLTLQAARSTARYASADYQAGFDGRSQDWGGKIGLRITW
jgi:outer membrane autotransporter protein